MAEFKFLDKQGAQAIVDNVKAALNTKADKTELENIVKYNDFVYNGVERKTIQLKNYDSISGIDTTGKGHNLVMLSKWDVADFGATGVHLNLNGSSERPTYNDDKEIAFLSDIPTVPSVDGFVTSDEVDDKIKTKIAEVVGGASEDFDTLKEIADALADNDSVVAGLTSTIASKASTDDVAAVKSELETAIKAKADVSEVDTVKADLAKKQDKGNYLEYSDDNGRKVVTLGNSDIFGAVANTEVIPDQVEGVSGWVSLMQVNKWNVADFGSDKTLFNINIKKGMRPTIQETGVPGPQAHQMAYLSDIPEVSTIPVSEINAMFA